MLKAIRMLETTIWGSWENVPPQTKKYIEDIEQGQSIEDELHFPEVDKTPSDDVAEEMYKRNPQKAVTLAHMILNLDIVKEMQGSEERV